MKSKILFTTIILLLFLAVSCTSTPTGRVIEEPDSVKIGYRGHILYLPAYLAQAKGYYAEQGLDVELIEFDSTNQLVEAVITGKIDAAVGGVNAIVPLTIEGKAPGSVRIFNLGLLSDSFDSLLVSADSDIKTVHDLEGKTISSLPGTAAKIWMDMMLEKEGLTGKVNVIQTAPNQQLNALASGSVDAIFVLEPLASIAEEKGIGRVLIQSPISTYYRYNMIFETSVFSSDFVKENPRTSKKIIRATDKAIEFINKNPEQAKEFYSEFTPVDDSLEKTLPVATYIPSYEMNINDYQEVVDLFANTGLLEERVDISNILIK